MLLGQNFGGRHQRALPARIHAAHGRQRRHHGFARAHVALQQAVHGPDFLQVACNLGVHPLLRTGQRKGQARHQLRAQAAMRCVHGRHQGGRTHGVALAPGLQLRELLGQQLLGFEANPGRVTAVLQRGQRHLGTRVVQKLQRVFQAPKIAAHQGRGARGQGVRHIGPSQAALHRLAQVGLWQLGHGGIHRGERLRQLAPRQLEARVHHFPPQKAAAQLAAHAHHRAFGQGFLVAGVKIEKAQHTGVAAVVHLDLELAPGRQADLAADHPGLDLHHLAIARIGQSAQAGLVLVAQWQVQGQVNVARQPELEQGFLGRGLGLGRHGSGHGP